MTTASRERLEADIRRLCLRGDFASATTAALRGYGLEIFTFLVASQRNEQDAADAFSHFSERIWKGLPQFDWASSFRTWAYVVARNASRTCLSASQRQARRFVVGHEAFLQQVADEVRTATRSFMKTEVKDRFARLREALPHDDQMLLTLRIDRKLPWLDLARVFNADARTPEALAKESARLRKRYQALKDRLAELGRAEGLITRNRE